MSQYFFNFKLTKPDELKRILCEKSSLIVCPRDRFGLFREYINWVISGRKRTTIRFRRGKADIPISDKIPIYATTLACPQEGPKAGWAKILNLRIIPYGELNHNDALNDGFASLMELRKALFNIYGEIQKNELVSIYEFTFSRNRPKT